MVEQFEAYSYGLKGLTSSDTYSCWVAVAVRMDGDRVKGSSLKVYCLPGTDPHMRLPDHWDITI